MKKIKNFFGVLTLIAFLSFESPLMAQTSATTTSNTDRTYEKDDSGKWGFAGLLGLLGLLGLRKKDTYEYKDRPTTNR